jgi:hypothetical protein
MGGLILPILGLTWTAALETGGFLVGDEMKISASVQAIGQ